MDPIKVMPCLDMKNGRVVKGVHFVDIRECRSLPSEGKGLPEDGEQHQGKGELAAHHAILICE